ncbi:MAG: CHAP domain-containing protein [Nocardioidaceae bacterium]|nr:CHAP domain-containing protein [Nocardioidaceae bacterium]
MRIHPWGMRSGIAGLASVLLAASLLLVGSPRPTALRLAASGNTTLCSGYSGCRSDGYSDSGYSAVNNKMYWRMYSGHNCTNYAAYRIIKDGGPKERPWSGGGNASEWGLQMRKITDKTPNVGAIAWWGRYDNGSGSAGHVAYVEKVVSSTEIIVSQDSWGGTFSWRRITKSSGRWPTGFIHFTDEAIAPVKWTPTAKGKAQVGKKLTARSGFWSVKPSKFSYSWFVDGERKRVYAKTFTPGAEDLGKNVTYKVRAQRSGYSDGYRDSAPTPAVDPGAFVPATDAQVEGTPYVGEKIIATTGTWSPGADKIGWRWYGDGKRILNQGNTLVLTDAMVGKKITVRPTAVRKGYTTTAAAALTAGTVVKGKVTVVKPITLEGAPSLGETLTVSDGTTSPDNVTRTYRWFRDGEKIRGAVGKSYKVGLADLGQRITARTALRRSGWDKAVLDVPSLGRSTSPGRIKIGVDRISKRKIVVRVRVRADQIDSVNGSVDLLVYKHRERLRLHGGAARLTVTFHSGGQKKITADYLGAKRVAKDSAATSIRIK